MRSHRSSDHDQLPAPPAQRKVIGVANFKLLTLVRYFGLADRVEHGALPDCRLTQRLYAKLNETGTGCN